MKGLYAKAFAGQAKGVTGVDDPYEAPLQPELVLETTNASIEENVAKVLGFLRERGYID